MFFRVMPIEHLHLNKCGIKPLKETEEKTWPNANTYEKAGGPRRSEKNKFRKE